MQNITISGRLGRDAELRNANGNPVLGFTVAVDYRDGRDKKTNWWRVSLWGRRGEALAQYLTKGAVVSVSGEFGLGEYDGKPQLNIRADQVTLLGGKPEGQQRQPGGGSDWGQAAKGAFPDAQDLDDDIPFASNSGIW